MSLNPALAAAIAESQGILAQVEVEALPVPDKLTQALRFVA
ncbi:MAG: hypothetical protein ACREXG_10450 [Polaromonas sp.]